MKATSACSKWIVVGLITSFTLFSANTFASSAIEIIHGKPVALGESYSVHTVGVGTTEIMCTGVIIGKNHILTAAHCKEDVEHGRIYFGTDKTNFVFRDVVQVTEHPEYCFDSCGTLTSVDDNDILIVEFAGGLPEGFAPVAIAAKSSLAPMVSIHLAGFGANEFHRYEDILKVTQVPFVSFFGNGEFKTNEKDSGSCNGDSGGPAFITVEGKLKLAGLTSRGDAACRQLGIYTMVNYYEEWIKTIVKE